MSQLKAKVLTTAVALSLVFGTGIALANPGQAIGTTSIHTAPSGGSRVVDQLYSGEAVDIRSCERSWCYITHPGPDGWVNIRALQQASYDESPAPSYGGGDVIILPGHHHHPLPPIIVDPGPKHPIHPIGVAPIGNLPLKPILGGTGNNPGNGHPITGNPVTGTGGTTSVCNIKPFLPQCNPGGHNGTHPK